VGDIPLFVLKGPQRHMLGNPGVVDDHIKRAAVFLFDGGDDVVDASRVGNIHIVEFGITASVDLSCDLFAFFFKHVRHDDSVTLFAQGDRRCGANADARTGYQCNWLSHVSLLLSS